MTLTHESTSFMDDADADDVADVTPWDAAVERFEAEGVRPGDVLSLAWFHEAFGLPPPRRGVTVHAVRAQWLDCFRRFCDVLAAKHGRALKSLGRGRYRVLHANEHTTEARRQWSRRLRRADAKVTGLLDNVRTDELTADERAGVTTAQNFHAARMQALAMKARRLRERGEDQ